MLHSKFLKPLAAILLVAGIFTACKKDAFSEKDAIAAQTSLLQTKFSYDLAIKQIDLQIQRSGDSAKIVIQNLVNSGATALEILKQTNALAQILQNQNNLLAQLRYADSLSRNTAVISDQLNRARQLWNDSVTRATNNLTARLELQRNYALTITDVNGNTPLANATVSVLPFGTTTAVTVITDATGVAKFNGLIIDPATNFIISAPNYGSVLVTENSLAIAGSALQTSGTLSVQTNSKAGTVQLYNAATNRNTVAGSVLGDLDLTNGDLVEGISGQLITFSATLTLNGVTAFYQFPTLSDASGRFSIKLPDGNFTTTYNSIRVQQKLFVNSWQDENAGLALPRIDSTGTTLATTGAQVTSGSATGYYWQFPNDANGRTVVAAVGSAFPNNNNSTFVPYNYATNGNTTAFPFTNIGTATLRTDSIASNNANFFTPWFFNNSNAQSTSEAARYRTRANTAAQPLDTIAVRLVSLVPGWLVTSPSFRTIVSSNGQVNGSLQLERQNNSQFIQTVVVIGANPQTPLGPTNHPQGVLGTNYTVNPAYSLYAAGAGGVFNQAAMFTPSGRTAYTNQTFATQTYSTNGTLFATNTANLSVTGGRTYFLPVEYRVTTARDRNPR